MLRRSPGYRDGEDNLRTRGSPERFRCIVRAHKAGAERRMVSEGHGRGCALPFAGSEPRELSETACPGSRMCRVVVRWPRVVCGVRDRLGWRDLPGHRGRRYAALRRLFARGHPGAIRGTIPGPSPAARGMRAAHRRETGTPRMPGHGPEAPWKHWRDATPWRRPEIRSGRCGHDDPGRSGWPRAWLRNQVREVVHMRLRVPRALLNIFFAPEFGRGRSFPGPAARILVTCYDTEKRC